MDISLSKASLGDATMIHGMQVVAFMPLLDKYKDYDTSPANEPVERIIDRMNQSFTEYFVIRSSNIPVGVIRIVKKDNLIYRVSPIFILPEYQGKGIAQIVFGIIEGMYNDARMWELDTIRQEEGNCYLYEKLGYKKTGKVVEINDKMSIVFYEKNMI